MPFTDKNIIVFGANGFVGTILVKDLLSKGANVVAVYRDQNCKSQLPPPSLNLSYYQADIMNKLDITNCISKFEADYIFQLASNSIVKICHADPYSAYMTNVIGSLNVLEAIRTIKRPIIKGVFLTSDKAYGPAPVPYTEDTPPVVGDTYATSKTCQDFIASSYAKTYNLPIVIARASNIYGPGDLNTSRLIPRSILNLLKGKSPVLYDGVAKYIREFVYVDDVVSGLETLAISGVPGEAYNIGGAVDDRYEILHLIQKICDLIDPNIGIEIQHKDFAEIQVQYLNAKKLEALGWNRSVSVDLGLIKTIEWYKQLNESK